jgi:hypothetical protein
MAAHLLCRTGVLSCNHWKTNYGGMRPKEGAFAATGTKSHAATETTLRTLVFPDFLQTPKSGHQMRLDVRDAAV